MASCLRDETGSRCAACPTTLQFRRCPRNGKRDNARLLATVLAQHGKAPRAAAGSAAATRESGDRPERYLVARGGRGRTTRVGHRACPSFRPAPRLLPAHRLAWAVRGCAAEEPS